MAEVLLDAEVRGLIFFVVLLWLLTDDRRTAVFFAINWMLLVMGIAFIIAGITTFTSGGVFLLAAGVVLAVCITTNLGRSWSR